MKTWQTEPANIDSKQELALPRRCFFLLWGRTITQKMAEAGWQRGTNISHRRPSDALFLCHDAAAAHCRQLTKLLQNCLCSPSTWPQTRGPDLFPISPLCQDRLKMEKITGLSDQLNFLPVWCHFNHVWSSFSSLYVVRTWLLSLALPPNNQPHTKSDGRRELCR